VSATVKLKPEWFDEAADTIASQSKLCKGSFLYNDGAEVSYCALGALGAAIGYLRPAKRPLWGGQVVYDDRRYDRYQQAAGYLLWAIRPGEEAFTVSSWNDRPETTKRKVVNLLRRAAKKLREEQAK
jgi:hypothetical protein